MLSGRVMSNPNYKKIIGKQNSKSFAYKDSNVWKFALNFRGKINYCE